MEFVPGAQAIALFGESQGICHYHGSPGVPDIAEHLTTLYRYASMCTSVVEFGTSCGHSTSAFLLSGAKVDTYDVSRHDRVSKLEAAAEEQGTCLDFHEGDVREMGSEIPFADLFFIDTLHTYDQIKAELNLFLYHARKYLILHDTETFGLVPEDPQGTPLGVWPAVASFMRSSDVWRLHQHWANSNGLTIFERRGP